MNKEFITYEQAFALKELGFDEPCFGYYDEGGNLYTEMQEYLPAPLYQQAFKWFREKYKLHPHICYFNDTNVWHGDIYKLENGGLMNQPMELTNYKTYEEAEQACLNRLIEIVKNK